MTVELSDEAKDDLAKLDKSIARRVATRLQWLETNAETISHQPLAAQWSDFYKLRAGNYRILYEILEEEAIIFVVRIRHRREVYR